MYTPHTVTVYNSETTINSMFEEETVQHITVLHGVFIDHVKAYNVRKSGLEAADSVTLFIPLNIDAVDGISLFPQRYIGESEYNNSANKSNVWTLRTSGDCFFVKGEVIEPERDFEWINSHFDDVYRVTKVDLKDFGSAAMQHIEVSGK